MKFIILALAAIIAFFVLVYVIRSVTSLVG